MKITQFGNPILRKASKKLTKAEINAKKTQQLIKEMKDLLAVKKLGVGLAAPQVNKDISLAIIQIQPLKHRSKVKKFDLVIINPEIVKTYGYRSQMWEGCISAGPAKSSLFAKVPRYKKINLKYLDENGNSKLQIFEGLPAHVIQHEVDHLNGVLFVDKVKDTKSFVTYSEYMRLTKQKKYKK